MFYGLFISKLHYGGQFKIKAFYNEDKIWTNMIKQTWILPVAMFSVLDIFLYVCLNESNNSYK